MRLRFLLILFLLAGCAGPAPKKPAPAKITPQSERHCLIFVVDGLGGPLAQQLMRQGLLPNFKKYIYDRGLWVDECTSVFPCVTASAMTSLVTGVYPGRHGITNFQWVDRNDGNYRSYVGADILLFNKDIDPSVKTVFQYFPKNETASFGLLINRGVGHKDNLLFSAINPLYPNAPQTHVAIGDFLSLFEPQQEFPRMMSFYEWSYDDRAHKSGFKSKVSLQKLRQADEDFGNLVRMYQERGHYDQTYFVLISDHGFSPVKESFFVDHYLEQAGFKTKLISYNLGVTEVVLAQFGRLDSFMFSLGKVYGNDALVGAAGGGGASVDLVKNGGIPAGGKSEADLWKEQLKYSDVRHLRLRSGKTVDALELLMQPEAVEFISLRDDGDGVNAERCVRLVNRRGEAVVTRKTVPGEGNFYKYEVVKGKDPLRLTDHPSVNGYIAGGRFYEEKLWHQILLDVDYPDIVVQVCQYFDSPRAPTLYLSAAKSWCINSKVKGRHAGPFEDEMKASLGIAGPGVPHGKVAEARIVDMVPTVLTLMGVKYDPAQLDGQPIPEAVAASAQPK